MIGEKIKIRLKELGLTQKDFAVQLNISPSTLSGYITGYRTPDINTISQIASELKVKPSYLLDNEYTESLSSKEKKAIAKDLEELSYDDILNYIDKHLANLPEEKKDYVVKRVNEIYWSSKNIN